MKIQNNRVILCCGGVKKCPQVRIEDNNVLIEDDYGSEVKMTIEQAEMIKSAIKTLKSDVKPSSS